MIKRDAVPARAARGAPLVDAASLEKLIVFNTHHHNSKLRPPTSDLCLLPFALPDTDEAESADAVRLGWVTTGPKTHQFESEFASYVGAKHVIAVNSCTAAMHLARS